MSRNVTCRGKWILSVGLAAGVLLGVGEFAVMDAYRPSPAPVKCVYFSLQNTMPVPPGTFIPCGTPHDPCEGGVVVDVLSGSEPFITQGEGLFIPAGTIRLTPDGREISYLTAVGTRQFSGPVTVRAFDSTGVLVDMTNSPPSADPNLNLKVISIAPAIAYLEISGQEVLLTKVCFAVTE